MAWINEHQSKWRAILLVLMVVAFMGPWAYDRINVPAEYTCSAPNIRLYGDFCGIPLSGFWLFPWIFPWIFSSFFDLITGKLLITQWIQGLSSSFLFFLPALPLISTLILILRGNHRRMQIFAIITWVLAIGLVLFLGLHNQKVYWRLWGIWLYLCLAISALMLETTILMVGRKLNSKSAPAPRS